MARRFGRTKRQKMRREINYLEAKASNYRKLARKRSEQLSELIYEIRRVYQDSLALPPRKIKAKHTPGFRYPAQQYTSPAGLFSDVLDQHFKHVIINDVKMLEIKAESEENELYKYIHLLVEDGAQVSYCISQDAIRAGVYPPKELVAEMLIREMDKRGWG